MESQAVFKLNLKPKFFCWITPQICPNLDEVACHDMITKFDSNGDGKVDESEFNSSDKEFAAGLMTCWQLQIVFEMDHF